MIKYTIAFLMFVLLLCGEQALAQDGRRRLSRQEISFLATKVDSIRKNLNRMVIYEKELHQKNYFLNEKTILVEELIAYAKYFKDAIEIIDLQKQDVRKIFGSKGFHTSSMLVYSFETYKSNCPFLEISFYLKDKSVERVAYRITDCQKWR